MKALELLSVEWREQFHLWKWWQAAEDEGRGEIFQSVDRVRMREIAAAIVEIKRLLLAIEDAGRS